MSQKRHLLYELTISIYLNSDIGLSEESHERLGDAVADATLDGDISEAISDALYMNNMPQHVGEAIEIVVTQ